MSILDQTKQYVKEQEESLTKQLASLPKESADRETLAQILDECLDGMEYVSSYVRYSFNFRFKTIEEAREFSSRVIDKLQIDKAEKEFEGYYDQPFWRYLISWNNLTIKVDPADADEGCKPKAVATASTHWICERKGE